LPRSALERFLAVPLFDFGSLLEAVF